MTAVPRASWSHRSRTVRVPHPRQPEDAADAAEGTVEPAPSREVLTGLPRRPVSEPGLVRTAGAAVLGMVVVAILLGAVAGLALLWLVTRLLVPLR